GPPAPARGPGPGGRRPPSPPAGERKPATPPRLPRPATCSPASSTPCVTGRPGHWPGAPPRETPREQARTRAARDREQVWPPPPGGAAAPLIDPAAHREMPHAPAASNRGNPEGMTAAGGLPANETEPGALPQPHTRSRRQRVSAA